MAFYSIPPSLSREIDELEGLIDQFRAGKLEAAALKAHRVPFGVYEQRKPDTYMLRIRCPGGAFTPPQLAVVADLAEIYGAPFIHITTRQELQLHEVLLDGIIPAMRKLLEVGLSTRGGGGNTVRNITGSVDSGISPEEIFDIGPYVSALTDRLIAEPDSWLMPRKFKIAFSNSPADNVGAVFNDLGFVAALRNGEQGFRVTIAGGMGTKPEEGHHLHDFVPASEVYEVAEAVKRLFGKHGNRKNKHAARLRFLWNNLGETKFLELYRQERDVLRQEKLSPLVPSTVPATAPSDGLEPVLENSPPFGLWKRRYVRAQKQPDRYSILIPVLLGNLPSAHARELADFLVHFGDDTVRATLDQNLILRNIPGAFLGIAYQLLKRLFPLVEGPAFLGQAVACTGADTCKLGICLPKGAITAVVKKLAASELDLDNLEGFKLNISGCPNTCGRHMAADLGFYGKVARKGQRIYPAYGVVAGAVIGKDDFRLAEPVGEVSARDLPEFVTGFLKTYLPKKSRFPSFSSYLEKEGKEDIRALCQKYENVPEFEENPSYYFDWGAPEAFSLVGRGVGECSAGLFDLIEVDLRELKALRGKLDGAQPAAARETTLSRMALLAARMLLITRGVEAGTDEEIFEHFSRHFIKTALLPSRFQPVIDAARAKDLPGLVNLQGDLFALTEAVEALYASMDNSLHFPQESVKPTSPLSQPKAAAADATKDLRGVACPMNFVKTKIALAPLQKGQRLRILLDCGAPIENVPRSVADEGHRVLEQVKEGSYWTVLIEKQ